MNELAQVISQSGLEALLRQIHAMVILVESDGRIVSWNPAFDVIQEVFPKASTLQEFLLPEERDDLLHWLEATCQTHHINRWRFDLMTDQDGGWFSFDCLLVPVSDRRVLFIAEKTVTDPVISVAIDKMNRQIKLFRIESEQAKKIAIKKQIDFEGVMAQMHEISNIDPLTFLPNRREILRQLQYEVLRAQRYDNLLSVSILDLDHFKLINDTYGHVTGDRVLREIAILLKDSIRQPDVVGRYGGEEFLILLPNTNLESASKQAARLCKQARELSIQLDNRSVQVTLSIGVAQFRNGMDTWQTVLTRADTAMYDAKRKGRDQWAGAEG
jgi:diguanylate cyclase (GGDEF)-like protein